MVAAIIGMLAVVAVPRYGRAIARQRVDAAARRIAVDLALARRQARMTGAGQEVRFDINSNGYRLIELSDMDRSNREYAVPLGEEPYLATLTSADFAGSGTVTFDGYGVPDSGGQVVVQVGEYEKTITLNAETGQATVP